MEAGYIQAEEPKENGDTQSSTYKILSFSKNVR
jgi:hypothetical protein